MSKLRVFELAKELGLSSKGLMAKLQELGFAITSHMSTLEEKEVKLLTKKLAHLKREKKVEAKKARPARKKKEPAEAEKKKPKKEKEKPKKEKEEPKKEKEKKRKGVQKEKPAKKEKEKPTKKEKPAKEEVISEPLPAAAATAVAEPPDIEEPEVVERVGEVIEKPPPPAAVVEPEPEELAFEDETDLLLEEKMRLERKVRPRERKKRKRRREKERVKKLEEEKPPRPIPPSERLLRRKARGPRRPIITVDEVMTVDELARNLKLKAASLILELMQMNIIATKNQPLELETVKAVAEKYDYDVHVATSPEDLLEEKEEVSPESLKPRAPVVTVMGHVDHGKTALLDVIRKTNVMEEEAGGITQHIGAYEVKLDNGQVVFLDTPGHEAFTAMRAHGAQVTDVVVLVVAADDGVMPQTVEAIDHARAAGVPIVLAINKIDKPTANVERVKQQLAQLDLVPEDWGGKTITVPVSAKTKEGINELLEMLLLEAELLELKANPNEPARGIILEAKLDKGRGAVGTVLVQRGTLRVGDAFVAGTEYGRVRAMLNDKGRNISEAGPSVPAEVLGFTGVPQAGDAFITLEDEKKARQIANSRALKQRQKEMIQRKRITLEDLYEQIKAGEVKELNIIIKGDVQGSVVALQDSLLKLPTESVKLNVLHAGVGGINESDVILASASTALVIGFNVRPDAKARQMAEKEGVDYRLYRVIYDAIDDVRAAMEGLLEPEKKEVFLGRAEVLQVFRISSVGSVAGCRVVEGEMVSDQKIRLIRDGIIMYDGKAASLKRYKDFVNTAQAGTECGIGLENFNDVKVGDVLECYRIEEIARKL
ncbi:MAG: translation initiation factor IF-2 [Candidatus Hydrogenedentota bacterium]|nr:MAG: translation initiation factor IF-2 [Candidatus Hydrogenedentota bacterium]